MYKKELTSRNSWTYAIQGITTKAMISKQSIHDEPQYVMDPQTPCKTYDQFG